VLHPVEAVPAESATVDASSSNAFPSLTFKVFDDLGFCKQSLTCQDPTDGLKWKLAGLVLPRPGLPSFGIADSHAGLWTETGVLHPVEAVPAESATVDASSSNAFPSLTFKVFDDLGFCKQSLTCQDPTDGLKWKLAGLVLPKPGLPAGEGIVAV